MGVHVSQTVVYRGCWLVSGNHKAAATGEEQLIKLSSHTDRLSKCSKQPMEEHRIELLQRQGEDTRQILRFDSVRFCIRLQCRQCRVALMRRVFHINETANGRGPMSTWHCRLCHGIAMAIIARASLTSFK